MKTDFIKKINTYQATQFFLQIDAVEDAYHLFTHTLINSLCQVVTSAIHVSDASLTAVPFL